MTIHHTRTFSGSRGRWVLLATAAVGLLATAVLAVRAGPPHAATEPPVTTPAPVESMPELVVPDPAVDLSDAQQVCAGFAAALLESAAADDSPVDAYRRAAAYATAELASAMVTDQGRWPPRDPRHTISLEVSDYAGDAHLRPDTDEVAYRAALVTITDDAGGIHRRIVYCVLRQADGWRVAGYELERTLP